MTMVNHATMVDIDISWAKYGLFTLNAHVQNKSIKKYRISIYAL